jgi:hypothetical protein
MDKRIWMISILVLTLALTACGSDTNATEESTVLVTTAETTSETTGVVTEATSETTENTEVLASDIFDRDSKIDRYAYELIMSSGGQVIGGFNLWVDGDRVRFDLAAEQGQSMYFDYAKKEAYIYVASENTLMKMPIESLGNEWESPFLFAEELDDRALSAMKNKGSEIVDGKKCQVFVYDSAGTEVTYFVWEEKGLILKMIVEVEGQPTYEYYFKNLQIDGNFDKELELPEGAKIVG